MARPNVDKGDRVYFYNAAQDDQGQPLLTRNAALFAGVDAQGADTLYVLWAPEPGGLQGVSTRMTAAFSDEPADQCWSAS
jgi:hypothetical protein